jgi:hypothetical protein
MAQDAGSDLHIRVDGCRLFRREMIAGSTANTETSMSAWGYGVRQDDFVCDVIGVFEDLLKAGKSVREATEAVRSKFAAETNDADDGPLFWIALADVQWTYGELDPQIVNRVKEDLDSGRSLAAWTEDQHGLARRRAALEKFISKIGQSNPRPRKLPKTVVRAPKFRAGECLRYVCRTANTRSIALAADHSNVEYGTNLSVCWIISHRRN